MLPIVLIHGYSAESRDASVSSIAAIYGTLPQALRRAFPGRVVEVDLGRYLTLEDGVRLDDISRALDRALREDHPHLMKRGFHAVTHSTGSLVLRNWLRRFSPRPAPLQNFVHLAGANFGSGWAHLGEGQLAKWARRIFQGGAERGMQVLQALELGSDWTLDLHLHFLETGNGMLEKLGVREHVVVGSQADVDWFSFPIRYAKEDGSDGVVRVASANLNYQYLKLAPTEDACQLSWTKAASQADLHLERRGSRQGYYEITRASRPGLGGRAEVPLAVPYGCAHSGEKMGIVTGEGPREQVLRLLQLGLTTRGGRGGEKGTRGTKGGLQDRVEAFRRETEETYRRVRQAKPPSWWLKWLDNPKAQYDRHAQVIFRVRDQDGHPVTGFDIYFDSVQGRRDPSRAFKDLIEDKHVNGASPNIMNFYLRTDAYSKEADEWISLVPQVEGCFLEISAVDPQTREILYLPLRFEFLSQELDAWICGNRTTIVDVELLRLPSPAVFALKKLI